MQHESTIAALLAGLATLAGWAGWKRIRARRLATAAFAADARAAVALAAIAVAPDRTRALGIALDVLAELQAATDCAFYGRDERGTLVREATRGPCARMPARLSVGQGLVGEAAGALRGSAPLHARVVEDAGRTSYLLARSVEEAGSVLGVLATSAPRASADHTRSLVTGIAAALGARLASLARHEELARMNAEIAARNHALAEHAADLRRTHRDHHRFMAELVQALRTPLVTMIADAEVVRDGVPGELNERQRDLVRDVIDNGERLLAFVNDIGDLARLEAGGAALDVRPTDVDALAHDVVSAIAARARAKGVALATDIDEAIGFAQLDGHVVRRIAHNLLANAVDATPEGGEVTLQLRRIELDGGRSLELRVSDTGAGIPHTDQAHLFEPWLQVEYALRRGLHESSVGVAILKRLAELHGGSLELQSEPGDGSTLTLRVPCGEPADSHDSADNRVARESASCTALIVGADEQACRTVADALRALGMPVATVPEVALYDVAGHGRPDVIALPGSILAAELVAFATARRQRAELTTTPVMMVPVSGDATTHPTRVAAALSALGLPSPHTGELIALVVDGDAANRRGNPGRVYCKATRFIPAGNAADALAEASAEQPHVIVLELGVSGASHAEVVDLMKALPETRDIPILPMTAPGESSEDPRKLLADSGARSHAAATEWMREVIDAASVIGKPDPGRA